ncbi:MAG: bifunctional DNA-formamidopyrimidine glycosylase/DNA-(apurinic or apyrimidinic site) lyase [Pseudomonadota bacterium]
MPELPEVETVRRGLAPTFEGRRITKLILRRKDLRFPFPGAFSKRVTGARALALGRRAKFLTLILSSGETLVMHLGMSGRFTQSGGELGRFHHAAGGNEAHDHVEFHLEGGARVTYNDPRRFGFMELWPTADFHAYPRLLGLGPEPLTNAFNGPYLASALAGKKTPIKAALLDQRVVAGLGNIYVCEALFRSKISPRRRAASIGLGRAERLAAAINAVIGEAIDAGGSSLRDFASADGELGYFQHTFRVYDQEGQPCPACPGRIARIVQSGRSSFYCGGCQR